MEIYEKLGAFYLGRRFDRERGETTDELVLYDSRDLTTHAVIIGMTGSGKTGLGIGLLEEAAIDRVPVIAIDPKGDLGNMLLTFPELRPEDFRPWMNEQEAARQGMSADDYAVQQAQLWREGLSAWGQDASRIRRLRDSADLAIYTPGSTAGLPVSVLRSFRAPPPELRQDRDVYGDRIAATATGLLTLLGIDADPLTSREHILVANLLEHAWNEGRDLDIAGLITAIQQPPMERIGVLELNTFYPAKDRFELAMRLNNLLAAPGFEAWREGAPLDAGRFLHDESGKPRVSIFSIAHLSDSERMFFVSLLLNEIVAWMRTQRGTSSLRAILYMDEVFGYLPPSAIPPSKIPLLTLLKQARAYGLGVVLATQNPVDLDYKALSNAGTWFLGRLQTERDKQRVLEGLEGAAAGGRWDRGRMEQILAGLRKRVFLLHNVHEDAPLEFETRWVMAYLAGPMTRGQIETLMADRKAPAAPADGGPAAGAQPTVAAAATTGTPTPPVLPPGVPQYFIPFDRDGGGALFPSILGAAEVHYSHARYGVDESRQIVLACPIDDGPVPVDWTDAEELDVTLAVLDTSPPPAARYSELPASAQRPDNFKEWGELLERHIRTERPLQVWRSPELKEVSGPGESERDFRIRLQEIARERRDAEIAKLRQRYESKLDTLDGRLLRARQRVEREEEQAREQKLSTAVSIGTALFAMFGGRSSMRRFGTAARRASRISGDTADIDRAEESVEAVQQQIAELDAELANEIAKLNTEYDAMADELEEEMIRAKSSNIHVQAVGIGWRARG